MAIDRLQQRCASSADLERLLEIDRDSFPRPWNQQMFLEELTGKHTYLFVASRLEQDKSSPLLGFICFRCCLDEATLIRVAVDPGCQQQGVAAFLMRKMFARLKQDKIREIFLEVSTVNRAALALYQSFGFQGIGSRPKYYAGSGEDALLMKAAL